MVSAWLLISPEFSVASSDTGVSEITGGGTAEPESATSTGLSSGSLLVMDSEPLYGPGAGGLKVTTTSLVCCGDSEKLLTSGAKAALLLDTAPTTSTSVPVFCTCTVRVALCPEYNCPNESCVSVTEMSGAPVTCRLTGMLTFGCKGSLFNTCSSAP